MTRQTHTHNQPCFNRDERKELLNGYSVPVSTHVSDNFCKQNSEIASFPYMATKYRHDANKVELLDVAA